MNWGGGNPSGMKGLERQQEAHIKNECCHWGDSTGFTVM